MKTKQTAIVIGTGAGGAVAAKELQGRYQVTILEAGKDFKPFSQSIPVWSRLRGTGMFFDERLTTMAARRVLVDADISRGKQKKVIDKLAAVLILQGYMDSHPNG